MDALKISLHMPKPAELYDWLQKRSWILTVLFFVVAFLFSLYIWWDVVLREEPRQEVLIKYQQSKNDFVGMSKKVEGAISKLEERKARFETANDYRNQKEIFKTKDPKEIFPAAPKPNRDTQGETKDKITQ